MRAAQEDGKNRSRDIPFRNVTHEAGGGHFRVHVGSAVFGLDDSKREGSR